MVKVQILVTCEACQGKAYIPKGEAVASNGEPYTQFKPCPNCQGSGQQANWVSLQELLQLLKAEGGQKSELTSQA
jgi:hypothetical protein